jgi:hypothetical protein
MWTLIADRQRTADSGQQQQAFAPLAGFGYALWQSK